MAPLDSAITQYVTVACEAKRAGDNDCLLMCAFFSGALGAASPPGSG
jgi:hypothetical protein